MGDLTKPRWRQMLDEIKGARSGEAGEPPPDHGEEVERRRGARLALMPQALDALGVPDRVLAASPQLAQVATALQPRLREAADGSRSLWLYGPPGTGKTHAAAVAARLRMARAIETLAELDRVRPFRCELDCPADSGRVDFAQGIRWADARRVIADVQACYGGRGDADAALSVYATCSWLVLEELGADLRPDAVRHVAFLLEQRYAEGLPTLITSNAAPVAVLEAFGRLSGEDEHLSARLASRIADAFSVVHVGGQDRRRAG